MTHRSDTASQPRRERPMLEDPLLTRTSEIAQRYLDTLDTRAVCAQRTLGELRESLGRPLPDQGIEPLELVERLASEVEDGLVASSGPNYYGFVIGGTLPAAMAADWLTSAWDQNAASYATSPAAMVVEDIVADWIKQLLGLPEQASVGFVTGAQMASFVGLAAGRHAVLERAGWDVEQDGLQGAPEVDVVVGAQAHVTIDGALRMLGLGTRRVHRVAADDQGRMLPEALAATLQSCGPATLVCAQAGNVNTGAFDPLDEIARLTRSHGAWLHVDGAFGLWAAAAPTRRHLTRGIELADSWTTDAHKWLNVPYDSGIAIVADAAAHRGSFSNSCSYLMRATEGERDGNDYTPDASRRARGFVLYAALQSLGREGLAELIDGSCRLARRLADRLSTSPHVRLLNQVELNQVLVRFERDDRDAVGGDALTRDVVRRIQASRTLWAGGTEWQSRQALRLSLSCWRTDQQAVDRAADAILEIVGGLVREGT